MSNGRPIGSYHALGAILGFAVAFFGVALFGVVFFALA